MVYTPNADYNGNDRFTFRANDGQADSNLATVTLTVRPKNDPPRADDKAVTVEQGSTAALVFSGSDIDGDTLSFRPIDTPAHGTLVGSAPNLRYTPNADFSGSDEFNYVANDTQLDSPPARVRITITPANRAPNITSSAPVTASVGAPYRYDVEASDPDGDSLTYSLLAAPAGMSIDPQSGLVVWTPTTDQVGNFSMAIRVSDGHGGFAAQNVVVVASVANHAPVITSTALTAAHVGQSYQYDVDASDADGDTLSYALSAPTGMQIDAQTGLIQWTPGSAQLGTQAVSVHVSDGRGADTTQSFTIEVSASNRPPAFVSQAPLQATRGELYRYDAQALDPDQDVLAFNLDLAPAGMTMDASTGQIAWTPGDAQVGPHNVRLRVTDGSGGEATQEFVLTVIALNRPPHITSVPVVSGIAGTAYRYDVHAVDPDGDSVSYRLLAAPSGTSIDAQSGVIDWLPNDAQLAAADVTVQATDTHGASEDQVFRIVVNADLVGHSHVGREFWFTHNTNLCVGAALGCIAGDDSSRSHWVTIAAREGAQGYVEIPGLAFRQDFNIALGGLVEIKLPWQVMNTVALQDRNLGVHVVADRPVTVVSLNRLKNSTDAAVIYPVDILGDRYTVIDYPRFDGEGGQMSVLATQDNTRVTFLPPPGKNIAGGAPGGSNQPWTATLQRGEAYMLQAWSESGKDPFSGVRVVASAPVAVFGGNPCANVPGDMKACDHLFEQLLPDRNLGQRFIAGPLATRTAGNMYRFVATEDDTAVYANERLIAVLQAGGAAERTLTGPIAIRANKPVQAWLLALGESADSGQREVPPGTPVAGTEGLDGDLLDPFAIALPPMGTALTDYLFTTPQVPALSAHFVSVVVPTSAADGLRLDDAPVTGVHWSPVPGTDLLYGSLQVSAGRHRLRAAAPFYLLVYGYGVFESYGYTGGLLIGDQDRVRLLEVTPLTQTRTVGDSACFSLVARDEQRRRVPYARFLVRVDGQVPRAEASYFDGTGHADYCFAEPFVGRNHVLFQSGYAQTDATVEWQAASDGINRAPVITSLPNLELHDSEFAYDVRAVDPNGDAVRYVLLSGPSGAQLDPDTGKLRWTPPVPDDRAAQTHAFVIRALDPQDLYAEQTFDLQVHFPPRMTALSGNDAIRSSEFIDAFSMFGGSLARLRAELLEGPPGMYLVQLERSGQVRWPQPNSPALRQTDSLQLGTRDSRADSAGFATETVWSTSGSGINAPVFGRLIDSNHDGAIDLQDRLIAVGTTSPGRLAARYVDTGENLPWSGTLVACFNVVPAIADLDRDGKPEIVYCAGGNTTLSAIGGDGLRKWSSDPVYGAAPFTNLQSSIEIADLDGDGSVEIVAGGRVYGSSGTSRWTFGAAANPLLASAAFHPLLSDLDGDGRLEVLFGQEARRADGTLWWTLPNDGQSAPLAEYSAFDFDGDGRKEVLASSTDGRVHRLERLNAAGVRLGTPAPLQTPGGMASVVDVDRDGSVDIVLPWERAAYALDGTLRQRLSPMPYPARSLESLADLNGDGALEQLNASASVLGISDLQSGWLWSRTASAVAADNASRLGAGVLVDSNGDGNAELFVAGSSNALERPVLGVWPLSGEARSSLRGNAARYPGNFAVQLPPALPNDLRFDLWVGDLRSHAGSNGGRVFEVSALNRGLRGLQNAVTVSLYSGPRDGGGRELQRRTLAPLRSNERVLLTFAEVPRDALQGWTFAYIDHAEGTPELRVDNNAVAAHTIDVRVTDGGLRNDEQVATVQVKDLPAELNMTGALPAQIYSGHEVQLQVQGTDLDKDHAAYFSVINAPAGVRIQPWTGLLTWTPTAAQAGRHNFSVSVRLFDGATANIGLSTEVLANSNRPPQITSTPPGSALVDTLLQYAVQANDPDGDALSYALVQAPTGMHIDLATGLLDWTPSLAQLGTHGVQVRVSDSNGNNATQTFSLLVQKPADSAPAFTSTPVLWAKAGRAYRYDADASNAGGATLAYQLTTAPTRMSVDRTSGVITWTPTDAQVGPQRVSVTASVGAAFATQTYTIQVVPRDATLQLDAQAEPRYLSLGQTTQFHANVSNAAGPVTLSATADGNALSLDASGSAAYTPASLGAHTISTSASDNFETAQAQVTVYVSDPSDTDAPTVHLSAPADLSVITQPTTVAGTVEDAHLASWRLVLKENQGAAQFRTLATGSNTFNNAAFATLDPTLLMNGLHILVLEATDTGGHVSSDSIAVSVEGAMKVGHFSVSFLDVEIPLSGIPIRVTRSYDTRRAHEALDFGYGWSVDYQNVSVRESRKLGFSWRLAESGGGFSPWCVKPLSDPLVTVTLPDGKVEKFRARFQPECQAYAPTVYGELRFEPVGDTHGQLEQLSYGTLRVVETGDASNLVDPGEPQKPVDPSLYRFTTAEGMVYTLDQDFGIRTVQDEAGNVLTYSRDGIRHSNGRGVEFVRDAKGRITAIQLPDGQTLRYGYDANGDLVSAEDQLHHASTYGYVSDPRWPHYLASITDPGRTVVARHEYDAEGRLVATVDANGQRMVFTHAIAGHVEQVKNRRGYTTTYVYDANGWVLSETNALNEQVLHHYDDDGNELSTTDALNRTTHRTFDARGNVLTETNPANETITRTYGRRNQLLTQTDTSGRVVLTNRYRKSLTGEDTGFLTESEDALGHITYFGLDLCNDPHACGNTGNVTSIADANGKVTGFRYDGFGNLTEEIDALGHHTTHQVDAMGRETSRTQQRTVDGQVEELSTRTVYDAAGRPLQTTAPDGVVTTYTYDANGRVENESQGAWRRTTVYTADGRVERILRSDGATHEATGYDAEGNVTQTTDALGRRTVMRYDAANRLTETLHPDATPLTDTDNPRTHQEYDDAGQLRVRWDERDLPTEYRYDTAGRTTKVIDALGKTTTTTYDAAGRRDTVTDALGHVTHFAYDDAGRLVRTTADDGTFTQVDYDALGRKLAQTDAQGRATRYAYDAASRLIAVVLANPETGANPVEIAASLGRGENADAAIASAGVLVTRYAYDAQGNKLQQTDALGRTTTWAYDRAGRVTRRTLPLGQSETIAYDARGDRSWSTDFNGALTRYTFDTEHRLTNTRYADDSELVIGYDTKDRPLTLTLAGLTETRRYDLRDRIDRITWSDGQALDLGYDAVGNRTALTTATRTLAFGYDALNRLQSVTETPSAALGQSGASPVTTFAYDAVGNRESVVHSNGTRTDYAYDRQNRLTALTHRKAAAILLSLGYALNPDGSRAAISEQVQQRDAQGQYVFDSQGEPVLQATRTSAFHYDAVRRLVDETVTAANANQRRSTQWTYDAVGNRLTQTRVAPGGNTVPARSATTTYHYDRNDRLLDEATTTNGGPAVITSHRYDLNGNLLETVAPEATTTYRWSPQNRLISAERQVGSVRDLTTFGYTADGIRRQQIRHAGTPTAIETRNLIDPTAAYAQVIEERIGSPLPANGDASALALKAVHTVGDDRLKQYALRDDEGVLLPNVGAPNGTPNPQAIARTFHADGLGSTRLLTDANGNVTDQYAYEVFGERDEAASVLTNGARAQTDFQYTGEQFDPNLGWYYLRARYMDPASGRFTQMDDFAGHGQDPASLHKYLYANANPVNRIDPNGHESLISISTAINIVGIGSTAIHASFRIAEGDYRGAAKEVARDAVFWALGAGAGKLIAPLGRAAMNLFSRTFMVPLEFGLARSGAVLTRNMEAVMARAGMTKPAGWQAHHIVGEAYQEGRAAMDILRRFKIDVNSPLNGVFLPGCGASGSPGIVGLAVHCGKHIQKYEQYLLAELQVAKSEADAVNILSRIRQELMNGELSLNARGNL